LCEITFYVWVAGIEVSTGPLGQGISNAIGMAIAERHMAATFNTPDHKIFDNFTYVICGDGCLQEGISGEASSLAGHLGLGKLIVLYDDNDITIDGETNLSFTEDVVKRYEAYGWHTQSVSDAQQNLGNLRAAITAAQAVTNKPSIIKVKTDIGYGSPSKAGTAAAHGAPLGAEDLAGAKKFYGLPKDKSFYVPGDVQKVFTEAAKHGDKKRVAWDAAFADYTAAHPEKAAELSRRIAGKLPDGIFANLPSFTVGKDKDLATRKFSEKMLNAMCPLLSEMVGGSADLTPSNCTHFEGATDFQKDSPEGRYFRFGVREHAMGAISNGIFAYGGLRPFCATFLTFAGYMLGAIRLAAISKFPIIYIMTHDSIGLGEDGPTHQPIETLESLRCMPNILVYRPADSNEMAAAYKIALSRNTMPTLIACSRSTVKGIETSSIDKACKGAYVALSAAEKPKLILIGTGSEVEFCMEAAVKLTAEGTPTQVVSMPCQEVFLEQSDEYQREVLPGNVPTLSVEASSPHGWHRFSHAQVAMTTFGASGSGADVFKHFGFSTENVVAKGKALVEFYEGGDVPDLMNRPVFNNIQGDAGHH